MSGIMLYKQNDNYVLRHIHDTYFFINITDRYEDEKCFLNETNEIGAFIWNSLKVEMTVGTVAERLFEAISDEVDYQEIFYDVLNYLSDLEKKKIILKVDDSDENYRTTKYAN